MLARGINVCHMMLALKTENHQVLTRTIANVYEWRKAMGESLHKWKLFTWKNS